VGTALLPTNGVKLLCHCQVTYILRLLKLVPLSYCRTDHPDELIDLTPNYGPPVFQRLLIQSIEIKDVAPVLSSAAASHKISTEGPDGAIERMKMAAVSRLADFSSDWYVLFTPVSKKSDHSCAMRVETSSSSKS
jgi:hypothetical protein